MLNSLRVFSIAKLLRNQQSVSLLTALRNNSNVVPVSNASNEVETIDPREPQTLEDFPNYFPPTFNFASYVNKSETLQKFVQLGVDLSKIEKRKGLPQYLLKLDFERDVQPHLFFLHDLGLPAEYYGDFLTRNPLIFKESIDDMETRVYYLRSKKFSMEQVQHIVGRNPYWLSFATKRIDRRLGWFQKNFKLDGDDIRHLATKQPRLITFNLEHIRESTFKVKEEMGFDVLETKALLLSKPRLWMANHEELIERFDYVHNKMNVSHDRIIQSPELLTTRRHRLKERHGFLKSLGKVQYDETKPGFIPFIELVAGTDQDFVLNVCKSSLESYDNFLKTL